MPEHFSHLNETNLSVTISVKNKKCKDTWLCIEGEKEM